MSDTIRMLIVEDSLPTLRLMQLLLDDTNVCSAIFQIDTAKSLKEATAKLTQQSYDVVLTDLMLPDCRGISTFRMIFALARQAAVLVTTGLDDSELALKTIQEGAEDYIVKGTMDTRSLATRICVVVTRHRRSRLSRGDACDTPPAD